MITAGATAIGVITTGITTTSVITTGVTATGVTTVGVLTRRLISLRTDSPTGLTSEPPTVLMTGRRTGSTLTLTVGTLPTWLSVFWPTSHAHAHPPTGPVLGCAHDPGTRTRRPDRTPIRPERPHYHTAPGP